MLASAKSKAHQAFKTGNYLVAARIYTEVYLHLAYHNYGLIDHSASLTTVVHCSIVFLFPSWNSMCDGNYALCALCRCDSAVN
jgi:hypothetical protein